jgi:hypothetical protein
MLKTFKLFVEAKQTKGPDKKIKWVLCPYCDSKGYIDNKPCFYCKGKGEIPFTNDMVLPKNT